MQTYQEVIRWIESTPFYGKKDGLNNMYKLMERLGNPQKDFAIIHVAGTNGKGSCCSMLSRILMECGYRCGMYTSPHLVEYRERMCINGEMIPKEDFVEIGLRVHQAIEELVSEGENHATFFEILTAMAFCWFSAKKAEWVLLETGVGGRLDATNVITSPRLCLITSVSLDHTGVLGATREKIAAEKAGIIKKGCPVIIGHNSSGVCTVIKKKAQEMGAPYQYAGSAQSRVHYNDERGMCLDIRTADWVYERLRVNLCGEYQVHNVAVVLEAVAKLREQGVCIPEEKMRQSLEKVCWPGRMEFVTFRGNQLLLDGAHNEGGAKQLQSYLDTYAFHKKCILVFSALEKKDVDGILRPLASCKNIEGMIFAGLRADAHCMSGEKAAAMWAEMGGSVPVLIAPDTETALEWARMQNAELIVCAGSLYLVGEVKELLDRGV